MANHGDFETWAAREKLPSEVQAVLKENGFTALEQLKDLTTSDVKMYFQDPGLLKLAHCLALNKAIAKLSSPLSSTSTPDPSGFAPPSQPPPYQPYQGPTPSQHYPPPQQPFSPPQQPFTPPYPSRPQHYEAQPQPYADQRYPPAGAYGGAPGGYPGATGDASGLPSMRYPGGECFRFLLLGKTGSGKSTTGNTIFGQRLFNTAATFSSVTSDCERKISERGGRKIEIIDSPGLYDTHKTQEEICVTIVQAVAGMHPGPHAILYVVRLGRYTAEEYGAYKRLKALFDDSISRYMVVLFTHGDMLDYERRSIEDLLDQDTPKELQEVLRESNNRYIVFNNVAHNTQPQVERLLSMVRHMVAQNGGQPYSCPKYGQIGQGMEEEVARRLQEVEKKDLQRQKYVQQLEKQTQEAEETAQRTKEQFQKNEEERQRRMEEEKRHRQELEERLQNQVREQEKFQMHQEELQRLHKEREEQERMMKEKEQEMTEKERQRAEEEAERMRQREQQMQEMMRQQEERLARQREEDEERRQQMERQRQEFLQQMEEQRQKEREELQRREEERARLWEEKREEERAAARRREEEHAKEMEKLKQDIVNNEDSKFIEQAVGVVAGLFRLGMKLILKI